MEEEGQQVEQPKEAVPFNKYAAPSGYVYFGVLGKTTCPFCRKWRDRALLIGLFLTVAVVGYELGRMYLERE